MRPADALLAHTRSRTVTRHMRPAWQRKRRTEGRALGARIWQRVCINTITHLCRGRAHRPPPTPAPQSAPCRIATIVAGIMSGELTVNARVIQSDQAESEAMRVRISVALLRRMNGGFAAIHSKCGSWKRRVADAISTGDVAIVPAGVACGDRPSPTPVATTGEGSGSPARAGQVVGACAVRRRSASRARRSVSVNNVASDAVLPARTASCMSPTASATACS